MGWRDAKTAIRDKEQAGCESERISAVAEHLEDLFQTMHRPETITELLVDFDAAAPTRCSVSELSRLLPPGPRRSFSSSKYCAVSSMVDQAPPAGTADSTVPSMIEIDRHAVHFEIDRVRHGEFTAAGLLTREERIRHS